MVLNDINFPNEIVDALHENRLVVFAGAGASMGAPTLLPSFETLANKIAEGSSLLREKDIPCEVFLGKLNHEGVDVNTLASVLLSTNSLKHNTLHEAIVNLFKDKKHMRIVTTNYDQMFEQVLDEHGISYKTYNTPALPLGNDFTGLVHVHGNVNDPKYMVLTDEDFGKAYLSEGYSRRFIIKLFESFTVLFIGYSYNDTIMQYLTRAMSAAPVQKRYILTDDTERDWSVYGIEAITYKKGEHNVMANSLIKLGVRSNRSLSEWKNQFLQICNSPSSDFSVDSEIDFCLESIEKSRILAGAIHGEKWFDHLRSKGVFKSLFSNTTNNNEQDVIWANWFAKEFYHDTRVIQKVLLDDGNCISNLLALKLTEKLLKANNDIENQALNEYILLLNDHIRSPWIIGQIITILNNRQQTDMCLFLLKKLLNSYMKTEKTFLGFCEQINFTHSFIGNYYCIDAAWKECKSNLLKDRSIEVLLLCKQSLDSVYKQYSLLGQASRDSEPIGITMLIIEDRDHYPKDDILILLASIICEACVYTEKASPAFVRYYIEDCLSSEFAFTRKIGLKTLRECSVYTSNEKYDLFIRHSGVRETKNREQAFLLMKSIFMSISECRQNNFINLIEESYPFEDDRINAHWKYRWFAWLADDALNNSLLQQSIDSILSTYDFKPLEHPELDYYTSSVSWSGEKSPKTKEELLSMNNDDLISLLINYKEDPFVDGPTRYGLMNTLVNATKDSYQETYRLLILIIRHDVKIADVWNHLLFSINTSKYETIETIELLSILTKSINLIPKDDIRMVADILHKLVQEDSIKCIFRENEAKLLSISNIIWVNREKKEPNIEDFINKVFNTTHGTILDCWIRMSSFHEGNVINKAYKELFNKCLASRTWEKNIAVGLFSGYFNYFYFKDQDWCFSKIKPLLEGKSEKTFSSAWEGFTMFSRSINRDTADVIAPVFLKAVKHLSMINENASQGFIEQYLTILIYIVNNPLTEYIPAFYSHASSRNKETFARCIQNRLSHLDDEEKRLWWNNWLKEFLKNRLINKPTVPMEEEKRYYLCWLPKLKVVYEEAVEILCSGLLPHTVDALTLNDIEEQQLAEIYPHATIKLITDLLNNGSELEFHSIYLGNIIKAAKDISEEENNALDEALLKRGITI